MLSGKGFGKSLYSGLAYLHAYTTLERYLRTTMRIRQRGNTRSIKPMSWLNLCHVRIESSTTFRGLTGSVSHHYRFLQRKTKARYARLAVVSFKKDLRPYPIATRKRIRWRLREEIGDIQIRAHLHQLLDFHLNFLLRNDTYQKVRQRESIAATARTT